MQGPHVPNSPPPLHVAVPSLQPGLPRSAGGPVQHASVDPTSLQGHPSPGARHDPPSPLPNELGALGDPVGSPTLGLPSDVPQALAKRKAAPKKPESLMGVAGARSVPRAAP